VASFVYHNIGYGFTRQAVARASRELVQGYTIFVGLLSERFFVSLQSTMKKMMPSVAEH
jgi:predicted lactoylglutathione lyase